MASVLLGPIFAAQGWKDSPFNIYPTKGQYMWRDMTRICGAQGLPLKRPSQFPRGSLLAARVVCQNAESSWVPDFVRLVYSANFVRDLDIASPFVIGEILSSMGLVAADIMKAAQSQDVKDRFKAQCDSAGQMGLIGAPSFVVGGEVFWGGDRLDPALDWACGKRMLA